MLNNEARAALAARWEDIAPFGPRAAIGHMPFAGHRNCAEVMVDELRDRMMPNLGPIPHRAAWCAQCEQRVRSSAAAQCASPFCSLRKGQAL